MLRHLLILLTALAVAALPLVASVPEEDYHKGPTALLPPPSETSAFARHFAWGVEAGSCIDLTGRDMTLISIDGALGYKNSWLNLGGIGGGIMAMMNNGSRCYPLYAMMRTSFSARPQLCFLDLRAGVAMCKMLDFADTQTAPYVSASVGFNLARGRRFASYASVGYTGIPISHNDPETGFTHSLAFASIRIGCTF